MSPSSSWDDAFVEVTSADVVRMWVDDGDTVFCAVSKPCYALFMWSADLQGHFMYPPNMMLPDCYTNGLLRLPLPKTTMPIYGVGGSDYGNIVFERWMLVETSALKSQAVYLINVDVAEKAGVVTSDWSEVPSDHLYQIAAYVPYVNIELLKTMF